MFTIDRKTKDTCHDEHSEEVFLLAEYLGNSFKRTQYIYVDSYFIKIACNILHDFVKTEISISQKDFVPIINLPYTELFVDNDTVQLAVDWTKFVLQNKRAVYPKDLIKDDLKLLIKIAEKYLKGEIK